MCCVVCVTLASAVATQTTGAQDKPVDPEVKRYLQQLVDKLRQFRVGRDEIDWKQVESKTLAAAAGAQSIAEAHPAIKVALTEIRDPWAMYRSASGQSVGPEQPKCFRSAVTTPTVPSEVGYLKVTPVNSGSARVSRDAAVAVRTALKQGDDAGAAHWILDLRGYFMGAIPAAVVGLSPLMGDGTVFQMQHANSVVPFNVNQTSIKANGEEMQMDVGKFALTHKKPRVAVLVDGGTAGVGELLAIAFEGRSDARVFGMPTCGIPPIRLVPQPLKDGAVVTMSAMRIMDRTGKVYRGPVEPHERIDEEAALFARAIAWATTGK
jgi:hypothetical protein